MSKSSILSHLVNSSSTRCASLSKRSFRNTCGWLCYVPQPYLLTAHATKSTFYNEQKICFTQHLRKYSSSDSIAQEVKLFYHYGLPVISVPLPSREELCQFTLRPVSSTVGDFIDGLKQEDKGVDHAHVYSTDGNRIASNTQIEHLLKERFTLRINEKSYEVNPPIVERLSTASSANLDSVKILISQLYGQLHLDEHQLTREKDLLGRLEKLKEEQKPFLEFKGSISTAASRRTRILMWCGLAGMATQFGILARLTWWEYSWDIMEPVTYFITYGTAIIMYGYFVLTQQEYIYPDARDRQHLRFFYKVANQKKFDVKRYNELCDQIAQVEQDLKRLRDPLQLHLPPEPIRMKEMQEINQP